MDERFESLQAVVYAAVDVGAAERLTGAGEHGHLARRRLNCALQSLHVRSERRIRHSAATTNGAKHVQRVRHGRNPTRRHERADLNDGQTAAAQTVHKRHLVRSADGGALVLQAIAWTHLHQSYTRRQRLQRRQ